MEEEEGLFKANAVNEEDPERDRATQEEEDEAVNEEISERDRATLVRGMQRLGDWTDL